MGQIIFLVASAVSGLFGRALIADPRGLPVVNDDRRSILPYAIGLGIAFFVHAAAISHAALSQIPFPTWLLHRAIVPILDTAPLFAHTSSLVSATVEIASIAETALLVKLAFAIRRRTLRRAEKVAALSLFAAMALYSLCARGVASADLYAYVADARLGVACYSGALSFADGPFHIIEYFWGQPVIPCSYGPVWIWFVHLAVGWLPDPQSSIVGLRFVSLMSFVAVLVALARSGAAKMLVLPLALDPTILLQYVADGHNDLFGIALLLWARYFAMRGGVGFALVLAALAGGSKLPFLPIAMLTFIDRVNVRSRFIYGITALCGGAALSLVFGGLAYLHALGSAAQMYSTSLQPGGAFLPRVAMAATLLTIGIVLYGRRTAWPASWAFASLGSALFPWYFAWGIPYAALDPNAAWPFLASIPIVVFCVSTTYSDTVVVYPLLILLPAAGVLFCYSSIRGLVNIRA